MARCANSGSFKKGEVRNPLGAAAHDPIKRAQKKLTNEYFKEVIDAILQGDMDALKRMAEDTTQPALKFGVARSVFYAAKAGNWGVMQNIIERLVGKIPDRIELTGAGGGAIELTSDQRRERLQQLQRAIQNTENESGA
jgi:hypothetical protein